MGYFIRRTWPVGIVLLALASLALAQQRTPVKRAAPPKFENAEIETVFFPDIAKEFKGERPATFGGSAKVAAGGGGPAPAGGGNTPAPAGGGGSGPWAKLISPGTIEDEIKAVKTELEKDVTTPGKFAGGDYKKARKAFSILAVMFSIAGEYDGDVRFKKDASAAGMLFSRSAGNCKVGTDGAYAEAKLRKEDLEAIITGGGLQSKPGDAQFDWGKVADRSPLMMRVEAAHSERLKPWTNDSKEFNNHLEQAAHEAEVMAVCIEMLKQKGMKDADDTEYTKFCDEVIKECGILVDAAKNKKYDDARKAAGQIDKACTNCHQSYRS